MTNEKAQELQNDYCDALVKMILFPEPLIGQTFDSMRPIDEHVETLSALIKRGADPTILKRMKTIVNSLPLD